MRENLIERLKTYIDINFIDLSVAICAKSLASHSAQVSADSVENGRLFHAPQMLRTCANRKLQDVLGNLEESFSESVLRLIDERNLKDPDVYKRAGLDRKHFSKIRIDREYRPSKQTAISLAIALSLNLDETKDLLSRAGYALSHSSKFDIIIEFFIEEKIYDIFEINEALFAFKEPTLGV